MSNEYLESNREKEDCRTKMTTPPDDGVLEEATGDLDKSRGRSPGGGHWRPRHVAEDGVLVEAAGALVAIFYFILNHCKHRTWT